MSARTPFFPSGTRRQEAAVNGDQQEVTKPQFSPNKSNPLYSDAEAGMDTSPMKGEKSAARDTDNKTSAESNPNDTHNKPLNVSGLIRSRTHSRPPQRIPANSVNGNNIMRPGTADPSRNIQSFDTHTIPIAAPTPFKASKMTPSVLMNTSNPDISSRHASPFNFKAPALPHGPQDNDLFANNAHIAAETRNSSHTADVPDHPRTLNGLGSRSMSGRMLGRNGVEDTTAHAPNAIGPKQNHSGLKRRNPEPEINDRSGQHQKYSRRLKESHSVRNSARVEGNEGHIHSRRIERTADYSYPANTSLDSNEISHNIDTLPYPDTENAGMERQDLAVGLDKLLGCDVNAFVEERLIEKYEQAVARWREGTIDQWCAGAEEIMSKYTKILDFVKDHINSKIALYATCAKKIDQHESVLTKREEILSGFQARLVKESESILGRSLGM